jgi:capsid portal protein
MSRKKPTQKKLLACGSCDLSPSIGVNGRRLDSFVLETDLYIEPTQKQVEQSTSDYVPFLDFNNRLLDELTSIINTSPTCRGIIMQKVNMSQGKGFSVSEGKQNALLTILKKLRKSLGMTDARIEELNDCIIKVNPEGETLSDLTNKAYFDFWAYGNAFIEVIKTTIGGECRVAQRHIPMEWCRPKKAINRVVEFIGISPDWVADEVHPDTITDLPLYPNFKRIEGDEAKVERSIIHLKNYAPGFFYWGLPDYVAGFLNCELEYRIPKYNQGKFINGYIPSAIVQFYGQLAPEEAQEMLDKFLARFTGTGNNAKIFAQVLSDESMKADVQKLTDDSEGNYLELATMAKNQIITAHRWTPSLAGVSTAGQLGSNQQIRAEFEILQNTVIEPVQNLFLSKWINPVLQDISVCKADAFDNISLGFKNVVPVSFVGDLKPADVLTINEQRNLLGFDQLTTEQQVQPKQEENANNTSK